MASVEDDLHEVRRAALVLRERDSSEAVRILRQVVRRGGQAAPLAHGALAEILLEDFDDVDGAAHHFRALLELVPGLPAGEIGLARSLSRSGIALDADAAYGRAIEGLAAVLRGAMSNEASPEPTSEPEALDETLLTLLEIAIERAELVGVPAPAVPLAFDDCLDWAEQVRVFDPDEDEDDRDDWERYADLRAILIGFRDGGDSAQAFVARVRVAAPLSDRAAEHAISLAREAAGDARGASDAASASLARAPLDQASPVEVLRTADLAQASGQPELARGLLEQFRKIAQGWPPDEAKSVLSEIDERLEAPAAAPTLVRLGLGKRRA